MTHLHTLLPRLIALGGLLLVITGCLPPQPLEPSAATTAVTAVPSASLLPADLTPTAPAHAPALTPTAEPTTLALGEPRWVGRGAILDALFLPEAGLVAVAWGSGVSLHEIETGAERWFEPTPTNLLAFDAQPRGQRFAAALADGSVLVFAAEDGRVERYEAARPDAYWGDLAWSPDGATLAVQFIGPGRGDPVTLLDVESGAVSAVPGTEVDPGVQPALAWTPDGAGVTLASLGDACPRVVDVQTGRPRMTLGGPGRCYTAYTLAWLPGRLAVAGPGAGVDLLRYPQGSLDATLPGDGPVDAWPGVKRSLFADPQGRWLAARGGVLPYQSASSTPLTVWDLASGQALARIEEPLQPLAYFRRLAGAFDGERILLLYENGTITRWDFLVGGAVEEVVTRLPAIPPDPASLRWSADGGRLAFAGRFGGVEVWDPAEGRLVRRFPGLVDIPALSPDGARLAAFDPVERVERVYDVSTGETLFTLPACRASCRTAEYSVAPVLTGAAFSPDGAELAYGAGPLALVTALASGETALLVPAAEDGVTAEMTVTRLAWAPDGQALLAAFGSPVAGTSAPGVVTLWQRQGDGWAEVYHAANVQASYDPPFAALALFNPSGSRAAVQALPEASAGAEASAGQMRLEVFDLREGRVIQSLDEYEPAAWASDDLLLAAEAQYDLRLTRIDVVSGEKLAGRGTDHLGPAYAPGGAFYAQPSLTHPRGVTVLHWRAGDLQPAARGVHEPLNTLGSAWSPDGRWLASLGDDGTLRVWPVQVR